MDIDRPRHNQVTEQHRVTFLLPKLREITLRPEFRIVFLCLAWFVLSRAKNEQQFFPSFLVFCIALLQFRLSGYARRTKIPPWIGNIGVIWYVFWIAVSLFAGLYGGLSIGLSPENTPIVMSTTEYLMLRQLIHYIFGADSFPLLYIWLTTFLVALFDWSFMLSPEEKSATSEIKKNRVRSKKKKQKT